MPTGSFVEIGNAINIVTQTYHGALVNSGGDYCLRVEVYVVYTLKLLYKNILDNLIEISSPHSID